VDQIGGILEADLVDQLEDLARRELRDRAGGVVRRQQRVDPTRADRRLARSGRADWRPAGGSGGDTSRSDMGRLLAVMTTTPPVDLLVAAVNAQIGGSGRGRRVACPAR
jgi:hypothetical protein